MRLPFSFRWTPFIATIVVMAIGIALGNWQTHRAAEKVAIEQAMQTRSSEAALSLDDKNPIGELSEFRRVQLDGEFIAGWPLYLDNRPYQGKAGFVMLMPLRIASSGQVVLVARGWLPRDATERTRLPVIAVPPGIVRIEGVVRHSASRVMQLGAEEAPVPGAIIQNFKLSEFSRSSGLALQTFIIEQTNDTADGLGREWPQPSAGVDKHRGYAFQWYALAATAFLFFLVTGFRRANKPANKSV